MKKQLLTILLVIAGIMLVQPVYAFTIDNNYKPSGPFTTQNEYFTFGDSSLKSANGLVENVLTLRTPTDSTPPTESGSGSISWDKIYACLQNAITLDPTKAGEPVNALVFGLAVNETGASDNAVTVTDLAMQLTSLPTYGNPIYTLDEPVTVVAATQGNSWAELRIQLNLGFDFFSEYRAGSGQELIIASTISGIWDGPEHYFFDAGFTYWNPAEYPPANPDVPGYNPPTDPPPGGTTPVPEPATMLLLGSGLIGLAGFGRKKLFK